jgi:hypothetical protein
MKEHRMKYLCLVYVEEKTLHAMPQNERVALSNESMAYCDGLQKNGQLIAASPLQPVETATTVRVRSGKTTTTDGPFAETKEQLGGYLLIDVRDLNDAVRIASKFPAAQYGSIEVRPLKENGCA